MTLRLLNYGNYGIFLIMGNAGFCPSAIRTLGIEHASLILSMRAFSYGREHIAGGVSHLVQLRPYQVS